MTVCLYVNMTVCIDTAKKRLLPIPKGNNPTLMGYFFTPISLPKIRRK